MLLLEIEDQINPIRYKNIFKMFITHILKSKKFEQLCSFQLSERQDELVREILQSNESGLNQLYYLSFLATRDSSLEGLKHATEFFDRLKRQSENINRAGAEEAELMKRIVAMLIKMHTHTLPAIQKKFAFEYLKLDKGKYQISMCAKKSKENANVQRDTEMDMDYDVSPEDISEESKYTPFLNKTTEQLMKSKVPKVFGQPMKHSNRRDYDNGKSSIIKSMKKDQISDIPSPMNPLGALRM